MNENPVTVNFRTTINPYRSALQAVFGRLAWDLRPAAWESRRRLVGVRDSRPRGRAVIVCNGPSLLETDLGSIRGLFSIGMNKINLLFDKSPFRPDCIVAINPLVLEQNADYFRSSSIPLFVSSGALSLFGRRPHITYLHLHETWKLAADCSVSVNPGATVTSVALQLAFHLGIRDVALVGCDHNFAVKGPANATVTAAGPDKSHFDPNYFGTGVQWQLPDLASSEYYYSLADRMYSAAGGRIVNCTAGGRLELFPRMGLADWISDSGGSVA